MKITKKSKKKTIPFNISLYPFSSKNIFNITIHKDRIIAITLNLVKVFFIVVLNHKLALTSYVLYTLLAVVIFKSQYYFISQFPNVQLF
jgi:hypothetical protein